MSQTDFNVLSPEGPSSRQEIFTAEAAEYIDLSSPTPQDSTTKMDSTNVTQSLGLQQASYDPSVQPHQGLRVGRKRLWGEMTGDGEAHIARNISTSTSMQWGGSGPRMQRLRPAVSPLQQQQQQQQQRWRQPQQPQLHSQQPLQLLQAQEPQSSAHPLRGTLGWPRSKQQHGPARAGPPVVLDDDSHPAGEARTGATAAAAAAAAARGGLGRPDRQSCRGLTAVASIDNRAASIAVNPNICHRSNSSAGWQRGGRRALHASQLTAGTAAVAAASAGSGAGRSLAAGSGGSSGSLEATSCSSVDIANDAELARKAQQEEEDAALAHRLMQEEQLMLTQQEAAERHRLRLEMLQQHDQAAQTAALQARGRRGARHPQRLLAEQQQQRQQWGAAAMAEALLNMPTPWGGSGGAAGRGLPRALTAVREALLGMQRAGLPPQLLFSDRDFTADDYDLLCRLDDTVENRKGAKSATIESMPTQTVPAGGLTGANGEKLNCTVCLEEFTEGAELRSLPCLHKYHKECIDKWLAVKASCPICNRECQ